MNRNFDRELGLHCAPALAGIKPANLLCCRFSRYPDFDRVIECYNRIFASGEIRFEVLCRCPESCLLLVYRRRTLAQQLQRPEIRTLLETAGYFRGNTVEEDLERLSQRLCRSEGIFPHESGKEVALFGSYGWGDGQWMRDWQERVTASGASLYREAGLTINDAPGDGDLAVCREFGAEFSRF